LKTNRPKKQKGWHKKVTRHKEVKIGQTTISWLSFIYPQLIVKLKFRLKIRPSKCKSIQGSQDNQIRAKCDLECLMLGKWNLSRVGYS
jgi:hypothetical protein